MTQFDSPVETLPPYAPPADYPLEPELAGPPSRRIPPYLRQGRWEQRWRQGLYTALVIGIFCLFAAQFHAVQEIGYYIPPLGYLKWIGAGVLALTVLAGAYHFLTSGRYEYVRNSIVLIARMIKTEHYVTGSREAPEFGFAATIELPDPKTGAITPLVVRSGRVDRAGKASRYTITAQPGDYVTAVYLQGKFPKSLKLYGFLGLNPESNLILKDGKVDWGKITLEQTVGILLGVVAILALCLAGIYSFEFISPIDGSLDVRVFVTGCVIGGLALAVPWFVWSIRQKRKGRKTSHPAVALFAGLVCGAMMAVVAMFLMNAKLDHSQPEYREVEVEQFWQTTHDGIIREYEIEYHEVASGAKRKIPSTVEHMSEFYFSRAGMIEVKKGYLGWTWIRQIYPVIPVVQDDGTNAAPDPQNSSEPKAKHGKAELKLLLDNGETREIDPGMRDRIVKRLQQRPRQPRDE